VNPLWLNYALLAQFAVLAIAWYINGEKMQALYWAGAFLCTAGVTF
jgi:drug/metabolite transporter (DMT)-like permease